MSQWLHFALNTVILNLAFKRTSSMLIMLVCSSFGHPAPPNVNWNLSEYRVREVTSLFELQTPDWVRRHHLRPFFFSLSPPSSELMWWIIHSFNSCSCWNILLSVKGELGLYWPSFYSTDAQNHAACTAGIELCQFGMENKSMFKFISLPSVVS